MVGPVTVKQRSKRAEELVGIIDTNGGSAVRPIHGLEHRREPHALRDLLEVPLVEFAPEGCRGGYGQSGTTEGVPLGHLVGQPPRHLWSVKRQAQILGEVRQARPCAGRRRSVCHRVAMGPRHPPTARQNGAPQVDNLTKALQRSSVGLHGWVVAVNQPQNRTETSRRLGRGHHRQRESGVGDRAAEDDLPQMDLFCSGLGAEACLSLRTERAKGSPLRLVHVCSHFAGPHPLSMGPGAY